MSSGNTLLLAALGVIVMCVAVSAAAGRQGSGWNYYHFDGHGFVAGQPVDGSPFLAVRNQVLPVVLTRATRVEAVALPPGTGALTGICYIRSSSGRFAAGLGYLPCPRTPITISSGDTVVMRVLSDEHGFFVALLAAGSYRISNGIFETEATVEKGTTVLVPLLAGKRMVD